METIPNECGACLDIERVWEIHIRLSHMEGHIWGVRRMLEGEPRLPKPPSTTFGGPGSVERDGGAVAERVRRGLSGRQAGRGEVQEPLRDALSLMLRSS